MGYRETTCFTMVFSMKTLLQHLSAFSPSSFSDLDVFRAVSHIFFSLFAHSCCAAFFTLS